MAGLTQQATTAERILGTEAGSNNGKSGRMCRSAGASPLCPQCGSKRLYKDGFRYLLDGSEVQRLLCRNCGYRFSEKASQGSTQPSREASDMSQQSQHVSIISTKSLKGKLPILLNRRVRDSAKEAKNLVAAEIKTVAGNLQNKEVRGLITQFMAWLEKEGYTKDSKYPNNLKTLVNLGADLLNPESVKEVLGKHNIKGGAKLQYVYAYSAFANMLKISWDPPKYKQEETLPFIPDESELDQLIAACRSRRMATYLQCLKETYADPGEALKLRWIDVSGNIITINHTVKGHLPRQLEVSNKLISMLNSLPKMSDMIFPTTYSVMFSCYDKVRKRAAELQKNPRLLSIELRTFRHWGGSMIAHYTNGNVLTVKRLLGHKRIENTMKYIGMIHFKDDEFEVTTATTVEEAKKVLEAGFDYITEKAGIMLLRRPKRFSKYAS
jgi:integrase